MVEVVIDSVSKSFALSSKDAEVLRGITLTVGNGEIVAIRGDNGCGKTTLLNIVAGIEKPSSGTVHFTGLPLADVRLGLAQQDYTSSLLPWLTVIDNIAMPLRIMGKTRSQSCQKARDVLADMGFQNVPADSFPHQLSGGQKQKVAVARALVHDPHVLLLDEPFANLDSHTRRDLEQMLMRIHDQTRQTIIFVSHELDRCVNLADRVVILDGRPAIIAKDIPVPLERPRNPEIGSTREYFSIRQEIAYAEERIFRSQDQPSKVA